MKLQVYSGKAKELAVDMLIIPHFEGQRTNKVLSSLGSTFEQELERVRKNKSFTGKFASTHSIKSLGKLKAQEVLVVGLGKREDLNVELLRRATAVAHKAAKAAKARKYLSLLSLDTLESSQEDRLFAVAEAAVLTEYSFSRFRTQAKDSFHTINSAIFGVEKASSNVSKVLKKADLLAQSTNYVRDLVNLPPNIVTPAYIAREAAKLRGGACKVTVLNKAQLVKGKFNGILAVGQGSANEPKLAIIDYNPKGAKGKSVALVGKGVTFDAGGLNVKPGSYMETMKSDMAGAAAVLGIVRAAKALGIKRRIFGVVPTVENMPGGRSYRPDDIITMYNGKTIEIGNTDAEGRIILADALAYTEKHLKPDQIIDFATLTGACVVALGYFTSGLMTTNEEMARQLLASGEATGDRVWRLPLWKDYYKTMESDLADVRNIGRGRDAGTITAAVFLSHFVEKTEWAHLDIAGTAYLKESQYYKPKNATGAGVRAVVHYLEQ